MQHCVLRDNIPSSTTDSFSRTPLHSISCELWHSQFFLDPYIMKFVQILSLYVAFALAYCECQSLRATEQEHRDLKTPNFCRVGYVMDTYCISLTYLLDKPQLRSLRYPDQHTAHCIVEIPSCVASGYELLGAPPSTGADHKRVVKFDNNGNTLFLNLAKKIGSCSQCTGKQVQGLAATIIGYLPPGAAASSDGTPPYISVTKVLPASVGCRNFVTSPTKPIKRPTRRPTKRPASAPVVTK